MPAYHYYLCDFEGGEVAEAELLEFTFPMQLVTFCECLFKWRGSIRGVQVEDLD